MTDDAERMRQLAVLRKQFLAESIAKRPQSKCRACSQAKGACDQNGHRMAECKECGAWTTTAHFHLSYVGHAEATDRLLDADLEWTWEPVAMDADGLPKFDNENGLWIRLTVAGVTRLGYGSADGKRGPNAIKEVIGDAIRNAGMRFGMALDLWAKTDLHADEHDDADEIAAQQDRDAEAPQDRPAQRSRGPVEDEWNAAPEVPRATPEQREAIGGGLRAVLGLSDPIGMLNAVQEIVGRKLAGPTELTFAEADQVLASLRETDRKLAAQKRRQSEAKLADDVKPKLATGAQLTALNTALGKQGITERAERLAWCAPKVGHRLASTKDLTAAEASALIDQLRRIEEAGTPPGMTTYDALMLAVKDVADGDADAQGVDADITAELAAGQITEEQATTLRRGLNALVDKQLAGASS
jgi:hypothetical protein